MKRIQFATFALSLLFSTHEGTCNHLINYADLSVEDPPKTAQRSNGCINIKTIVEDDILKDDEKYIEGINLSAGLLTNEGIRYLVDVITNPENTDRFKNLKYLNLTATRVDAGILEICRPLLEKKNFKFLDICRTPASESPKLTEDLEGTFKELTPKIIYVPLMYLNHFKPQRDKKELYIIHKQYHELNVWQ